MARYGVRKAPTVAYTIGTWTTLDGLLALGGDSAQATSTGQIAWALRFGDFSEIPADVTIKGILIHLVGKKTEVPASDEGTLYFGVELTWAGITGGGAGVYTSTGRKTTQLSDQWWVYEIGVREEATPWGRTWSRSEFDDDNFQIRIATAAKAVLGSPTWHIDYVTATIFYDWTESVTPYEPEGILVKERVVATPQNHGRHNVVWIREDISPGGTAVDPIKSDPTFATSAERYRRLIRFGARMDLGPSGPILHVGDSSLAGQMDLSYPGNAMQPGLVSVGEISAEGDFGADRRVSSVEIRFLNRPYVDQRAGAATTPKTIPEHAQDEPLLGKTILLWAFVDSGDGWQQRLLFEGQIEDVDFEETVVVVRALRLGTGSSPVPNLFVDSTLFDFYPGSSTEGTGEEIESNRGRPVPIGIGRFDYTAVKHAADFESGHPFKVNDESGSPTEDAKTMTMMALQPGLFGKLFPMMPVIHAAKKWRRTTDYPGLALADMNVLLYGSRAGSPELRVHCGPDPGHVLTNRFPGVDTVYSTRSSYHNNDYFLLWAWTTGGGLSAGTPFFKCLSPYWISEGTAETVPDDVYKQAGAGFMEALLPRWSDGTALNAFGLYIAGTFRMKDETPEVKWWPGVQQILGVPMAGATVVPNRTRHFQSRWAPVVRFFWNNDGSDDYSKAMTIADLETKTRVQPFSIGGSPEQFSPGQLCLQAPLTAPGSGKMRGVRFCALWNTTYTATAAHFAIRTGYNLGYQIWANWETFSYWKDEPESDEYNRDHNSQYDDATFSSPTGDGYGGRNALIRVTDLSKGFASVWAYAPFDPHLEVPHEIVNGSSTTGEDYVRRPELKFPGTPGGQEEIAFPGYQHTLRGDWDFTGWDVRLNNPTLGQEQGPPFAAPIDALLVVSGGYLDVYAFWMEVAFDSSLAEASRDLEYASRRYVPGPNYPGRDWARPGVFQDYTLRFPDLPPPERTLDGLFVTGKGALDDAGDITGTAGRIIENPADVGAALIKHFAGELAFSTRATGSDFGSFATARTLLGATSYRMTLVVQEALTLDQVLRRIGSQARAFFAEQLDDDGNRVWRVFVDDPDPETNDPGRLYRTDGYGFTWNRIAPGSFTATSGLYQNLSSSFVLRFGWHIPSGAWSGKLYCNPDGTNFATSGSTYVDALAATKADHGNLLPLEYEAPDVWDPAVAEELLKWRINRARRRRVLVEFETYAGAMDLQEGHVIKFADEIGDREKWPGLGSTSWSAHQFNVVQVSTRGDEGQQPVVRVVAAETHSTP